MSVVGGISSCFAIYYTENSEIKICMIVNLSSITLRFKGYTISFICLNLIQTIYAEVSVTYALCSSIKVGRSIPVHRKIHIEILLLFLFNMALFYVIIFLAYRTYPSIFIHLHAMDCYLNY